MLKLLAFAAFFSIAQGQYILNPTPYDGCGEYPVVLGSNPNYFVCMSLQGLAYMFQSEDWNVDPLCQFSSSNKVTTTSHTLSCISSYLTVSEIEEDNFMTDFSVQTNKNFVFSEANYNVSALPGDDQEAGGYGPFSELFEIGANFALSVSQQSDLLIPDCLPLLCTSAGLGASVSCSFTGSTCIGDNCGACGAVAATDSPTTSAPVTSAPVTSAPLTSAPVTSAPVTSAPVTSRPVTSAPSDFVPSISTQAPTVGDSISKTPTTSSAKSSLFTSLVTLVFVLITTSL